jgi:hypothetical protein
MGEAMNTVNELEGLEHPAPTMKKTSSMLGKMKGFFAAKKTKSKGDSQPNSAMNSTENDPGSKRSTN